VGNHERRNPVRKDAAGGKPPLHSILKHMDDATALAATDPDWIGPTEWLMDTGSSVDLVGVHEIPDDFLQDFALDVPTPVNLSTANGKLAADKYIELQVGPLQSRVNTLLLKNTPPVLSVGRRIEEGYSFIWRAGHKPYLKTPDGERIELEVRDYVPYLPDGPEDLVRREAAERGQSPTSSPCRCSPR